MFAGGVEEFVCRERHRRCVEDTAGGTDERNDKNQLERIDDVIADLRGCDVETEEEGQSKTEEGGAAENRVDADEKAGRDAPG